MARQTENFNRVTQIVPDTTREQTISAVAKLGDDLVRTNQEAKINKGLAQANSRMSALQRQYQIDFQGDPLSGMDQYNDDRKQIFDDIGETISPMFRGAWDEKARNLQAQNDATQQGWAFKQLHVNTVQNINDSMRVNYLQANTDGQTFASIGSTDIEGYLNYANSRAQLEEFGNKNLGETDTKKLLQDYQRDYMKAFLSGVSESNPQKAAQLLDDPVITDTFTPDEKAEFVSIIKRADKVQKLQKSFVQVDGSDTVTEIVNSDEGDYYTKRNQIDRMEFEGTLSPKIAARARRVLTSQNNIDSITATPVMADIITQAYDLNVQAGMNNEEYLNGVQNIRSRILEEQDKGNITPQDAKKLNGQIRTLTSAKVAEATEGVAINFKGAQNKFDGLPPEYRGEATRELFYRTQGKDDLSKKDYTNYANQILDDINARRNQKAKDLVNQVKMKDDDFVKSTGYTMEDIEETARIHGVTTQEVINKLRSKRAGQ